MRKFHVTNTYYTDDVHGGLCHMSRFCDAHLLLSSQVLRPRFPGSLVGAGGLDKTFTETHYEH